MAFFCLAARSFGATVPAGTDIQIRLQTKVATDTSKPNDAVDAVVIAPVLTSEGRISIPDGSRVRGSVASVHQAASLDERATLALSFTQLQRPSGKPVPIEARLAAVDNARETVDGNGTIQGIVASETGSAKLDQGIAKVGEKYADLANILEGAKAAVLHNAEGAISYPPGVEMTVRLEKPLELSLAVAVDSSGAVQPIAQGPQLEAMVNAQPFQTVAQKPAKPSDLTNVMFLGTREQVEAAFKDAGWARAAKMSGISQFETFKALAEQRSYDEAPVSTLLLGGQKPDMIFEKTNNTFARRHHLRIWLRPGTFDGLPIWVSSATHDTGISFSQQDFTFIHRIDSEIDRERAKVTSDLIFGGHVRALALVARPRVPRESQNATGDKLVTDGMMAVMELK
jgi:hypothetical protein